MDEDALIALIEAASEQHARAVSAQSHGDAGALMCRLQQSADWFEQAGMQYQAAALLLRKGAEEALARGDNSQAIAGYLAAGARYQSSYEDYLNAYRSLVSLDALVKPQSACVALSVESRGLQVLNKHSIAARSQTECGLQGLSVAMAKMQLAVEQAAQAGVLHATVAQKY